MTVITRPATQLTHALAGLGQGAARWLTAFGEALVAASHAGQCMREVERLQGLSDRELADMGLARDEIVGHVFRRYI